MDLGEEELALGRSCDGLTKLVSVHEQGGAVSPIQGSCSLGRGAVERHLAGGQSTGLGGYFTSSVSKPVAGSLETSAPLRGRV